MLYHFVYYGGRVEISRDILPDRYTAASAMSEWFNTLTIENRNGYPEKGPNIGEFKLNKEQEKRHRYRIKPIEDIHEYMPDEATWLVWSLYITLVPPAVASYLKMILPFTHMCDKERLSALSGLMKKYQHLITSDWIYYVDLQTLGDYVPSPTPERIHELITDWVTIEHEHELKGFDFYSLYRLGCHESMFPHYQEPSKKLLTIREFLSDPMYWATPGSSDAVRLQSVDQHTARKSKWATASAISMSDLTILFYSRESQVLTSAPKRELGKPRMIISGDMANYLRMSFISYWLEDTLRGHPHTTLFYNKGQMLDMWYQMVKNTNGLQVNDTPKTCPNVTLDESKFDHNVNTRMLSIKLVTVYEYIDKYADPYNKQELLSTLNMIYTSIVGKGYILVRFPGRPNKKIYVKNGILSGWRWTAFLDTLSNMAKIIAFRMVTILRAGGKLDDMFLDPIKDYTSQGDDIRSRARSFLHAQIFTDLYAEAGFEVHPRKFFVSQYADEFLRKVALYGTELRGYPARGVATLVFANPVSMLPQTGEERVKETINSWLMTYRRIQYKYSQLEEHMCRDVARGNNIKKEDVRIIVHAYANNGGMGVNPTNNKKIQFVKAILKSPYITSTPPLIHNLTTDIDQQNIIKRQWLAGVTWKKPATVIRPSAIIITEADVCLGLPKSTRTIDKATLNSTILVDGPRPRDDITPSVIHAYKEQTMSANRQDMISIAPKWMDAPSLAVFNKYKNSMSRRTIVDWINGKLIGSPPNDLRQGPIYTSPRYKEVARAQLVPVLTAAQVRFSSIKRAQIIAEMLVTDSCLHLEIALGE